LDVRLSFHFFSEKFQAIPFLRGQIIQTEHATSFALFPDPEQMLDPAVLVVMAQINGFLLIASGDLDQLPVDSFWPFSPAIFFKFASMAKQKRINPVAVRPAGAALISLGPAG